LPQAFTTRELRYPCKNELKKTILEQLSQRIEENPNLFEKPIRSIIRLDGLRIIFEDGFAMIRQSNTEPVFTARFEAPTENEAMRYQAIMVEVLDELIAKNSNEIQTV